ARLAAGRGPDVGAAGRNRAAVRPGAAAGPGLPGEPGPLRPGRQFRGRPRHPRLPQPQLAVRRAHPAGPGGGHVPARPRDRARREARLMAGEPDTAAGRAQRRDGREARGRDKRCAGAGITQRAWPAVLVLEDGTTYHGTGFGARGETFGEMVFNTGMTGYQET